MYAAMVCAGAAAWLIAGRDDAIRRARLLLAGTGSAVEPRTQLHPRISQFLTSLRDRSGGRSAVHAWWCLAGGCGAGAAGRLVASAPGWSGRGAHWCGRWLFKRERGKAAERRASAVVELCGAVSGELRAGRQPDRALLSAGGIAVRELGEAGAALLAAARFGGDVPAAMREASQTAGC